MRVAFALQAAVLLIALGSGGGLPLALAGDGGEFAVTQLIGARRPKPSGLVIRCDCRGWAGSGYREVKLDVRSLPPSTRERTITIDVAPNGYTRSRSPLVVSRTVTLPKGHRQSTVTMLVPEQVGYLTSMRVDVSEDGRRLEANSMDYGDSNFQANRGSRSVSEAYPAMLFLDADAPPLDQKARRIGDLKVQPAGSILSDLPDMRSLAVLVHPYSDQGGEVQQLRERLLDRQKPLERGNDLENLEFVEQATQLEVMPPDAIPDSWLGLSSLDFVFISLDDLRALARQNTDKAERLLTFISTGPTLVVHGLGGNHARLEELHALVGDKLAGAKESVATAWRPLGAGSDDTGPMVSNDSHEALSTILSTVESYRQSQSPGQYVWNSRNTNMIPVEKLPIAAPDEPLFRIAQLGFGNVIAVAGDEPIYGRTEQWHWLLAQLRPRQWMWYQRHGLSLGRENPDYWEFLIPGLGAAPVKTFLLVITAFAVVVGPINYWWLRRRAKLYLLLATVPAAAALLTLGMFAYVVVHDGLATRLRCRSVTWLDDDQDTAISWARQSYYSGLAPTGGMTFPADAAVIPVHFRPMQDASPHRRLGWEGDQQHLAEGYHRSRTLTQLLVIRPQASEMSLPIRRRADTGVLEVNNQLGVPLHCLVIRDDDAQLYLVENLPAGGRAAAKPTTPADVYRILHPLQGESDPALPEGFDADYHTRSFAFRNRYYWSMDDDFPEPTQRTSILERRLRQSPSPGPPPGRAFWAYATTVPPSVPIGIDRVEQVAGLHLIQGEW